MFHLSRVLGRAAQLFGARTAIEDGTASLTYGDLAERVGALAASLSARGVLPGDRVALLDQNSFRCIELHFACAAVGAILVPLNVRLAKRELRQVLGAVDPALIFVSASLSELVDRSASMVSWETDAPPGSSCSYESLIEPRNALPSVLLRPDDIAQIYFTSGTSGEPKGVCLTHANLVASSYDAIAALELNANDVWLHVAPMFHLVDAFAIWAISLVGGRHVVRHFDPLTFPDVVSSFGVTKTSMPPTLIALAAEQAVDGDQRFRSLQRVSYGGSTMTTAVHRLASRVMRADFLQAYGITEASGIVTQQMPGDYRADGDALQRSRLTSTGAPVVSVDLRIADDTGRDVMPGAVGEILVAGPRVMTGYWGNPTATDSAIVGNWYHTGDLGRRDESGHLFIVGRKKDMIITGGENVYPTEVENALALHPAVLEAAVFGVPSERWGEEVRAVVVIRDGFATTPDDLVAFCRQQIGGYKIPKSFDLQSEPLPKTGPGKVAKNVLRSPFWASEAPPVDVR